MNRRCWAFVAGVIFITTLARQAGAAAGAPEIVFLDAAAAREAILDDQTDPYFGRLQFAEMAAKTGKVLAGVTLEEQRRECRRRYRDAVLDFTDEEKTSLRWYVGRLAEHLDRHYPWVGAMPWSFIKVADHLEGGLPHTRGRHIILSSALLQPMLRGSRLKDKKEQTLVLFQYGGVLLHEQLHVAQRADPDRFAGLYTEVWGFEKAARIEGCPWLDEHQILNPDGLDCCWILPIKSAGKTRWIWPLLVLQHTTAVPQMPQDFQSIAIELEKLDDGYRVKLDPKKQPVFSSLRSIREFTRKFPGSADIHHPNEAAADLFSRMVLIDAFTGGPDIDPEALRKWDEQVAPLRRWFRENLLR